METRSEPRDSPAFRLLAVLLILAALALAGGLFLLSAYPREATHGATVTSTPDPGPVHQLLTPEAIARHHDRITGFGSRLPGQPGYEQTIAYLQQSLEEADLEVLRQEFTTVSPLSRLRSIARMEGDRPVNLPGIGIYPLLPNAVQAVVTPAGGLTGELVRINPESVATRKDFTGVIGLVDTRPGQHDPTLGFAWERYARLGMEAVILAHPDGIAHIPWHLVYPTDNHGGMSASTPINFVRLAADPGIFAEAGRRIRLEVHSRMEMVPATNLLGILRAPQPAREAVVITTLADAYAALPDRAVGTVTAISPAFFLQLAELLARHRDTLQRDVIFFVSGASFTSFKGENELIKTFGSNRSARRSPLHVWFDGIFQDDPGEILAPGPASYLHKIAPHESRHRERLEFAADIARQLERHPAFLTDPEATDAALGSLDEPARAFLDAQLGYVVDSLLLEQQERLTRARIDLERLDSTGAGTPELERFLRIKFAVDRVSAIAGKDASTMVDDAPQIALDQGLADRLRRRIDELARYHRHTLDRYAVERTLVGIFGSYDDFAAFEFTLMPDAAGNHSTEVLSILFPSGLDPELVDLHRMLKLARDRMEATPALNLPDLRDRQETWMSQMIDPFPVEDNQMWRDFGRGHYHFMTVARSTAYRQFASPGDLPWMRDLDSLRASFVTLGYTALLLGHGEGSVGPVGDREFHNPSSTVFSGRVLASGIGNSIVPDFPLAGALVFPKTLPRRSGMSSHGRYDLLVTHTDPYGEYLEISPTTDYMDWNAWYARRHRHSPMAVTFGEDGLVQYIKDEGPDGQRLFKSNEVTQRNDVTIVTFRGSPVTLLDLTNPKNLTEFTGVEHLTAEGLAAFRKRCTIPENGIHTTFLPPDERFVTLLKAGALGNDMVQETRAFILNPPEDPDSSSDAGRGYLVADHPRISRTALEAARSLKAVNGDRLGLQQRYHMADEQTVAFQERATELLAATGNPGLTHRESSRLANRSATYGMLAYPVVKSSVFQAVVSILWYLGLLVPFVFFAEKLIFNANDIRQQIAVQAVIFLTVFALLRLLHPAFQMIRSSLMILLGFIIVLIAGGITLLFYGKFNENFAELRKSQGQFAGTRANTLGVTLTAFLVGLNNMHRRKLRTGLTCATIALLTFVMISFTSIRNPLRDTSIALAKAPYDGFLVKRDRFLPVSEAELFALQRMYGDRYQVVERSFWVGGYRGGAGIKNNAEVIATRTGSDGIERSVTFSTLLQFEPEEPLRNGIEFLTRQRWFPSALPAKEGTVSPKPTGRRSEGTAQAAGWPANRRLRPVLLPAPAAAVLGISPEEVDAGDVTVNLNGVDFRVHAIFDPDSLDRLQDLDGSGLLPFDITRLENVAVDSGASSSAGALAPSDATRIAARDAVIAPIGDIGLRPVDPARERLASVAVHLADASYREASEVIQDYLTRVSQPTYYGINGIAYQGEIRRTAGVSGLVDLLVPLLIAAVTVLNTMRGSVYERRDEIYVYNAVGIAPKQIFFMFFAEAIVYAVVGALTGYLLSQGVGRVLTEIGLTGGLEMTYSGLSTIYASLAIMTAVLVSTWFPARDAMRIAAPSDDAGWDLPEPENDRTAFDLPFTFSARERFAVLEFVDRYLREHGEGSAGRFFCNLPGFSIIEDPTTVENGPTEGLMPRLTCTVWLKPFDLGLSQHVTVDLPFGPATGKFTARVTIERISGTREAWTRHLRPFVTALRRHFLHWRAVPEPDRDQLFSVAQRRLTEAAGV